MALEHALDLAEIFSPAETNMWSDAAYEIHEAV